MQTQLDLRWNERLSWDNFKVLFFNLYALILFNSYFRWKTDKYEWIIATFMIKFFVINFFGVLKLKFGFGALSSTLNLIIPFYVMKLKDFNFEFSDSLFNSISEILQIGVEC